MKKLFAAVFLLILVSGCIQNECNVDSDCNDKTCFEVKCVNNKCSYKVIEDCCGNEICEVGEVYPDCADDCPDCDDNNNCTTDSYDYHEKKCSNKPVLDRVCCGNGVCETGESYTACAADCPNCDDDNECTEDSYDYHNHECINEVITPCCGNGICDEGTETNADCEADCPDCDDGDRLTNDSFNYKTQQCENVQTHYFIDDFEGGTDSWTFLSSLDGHEAPPEAWNTVEDNGNTVLNVSGGTWALLMQSWENYAFKFRFNIISGTIHFHYKGSVVDGGHDTYVVGIGRNPHNDPFLAKILNGEWYDLYTERMEISEGWHTMDIRSYGSIINIFLDDELIIFYKDTSDPIFSGQIAIHPDNAEVLIDDVEIIIITEEDVVTLP